MSNSVRGIGEEGTVQVLPYVWPRWKVAPRSFRDTQVKWVPVQH